VACILRRTYHEATCPNARGSAHAQQWANTLATSLDQFYLETVLPSLDGLALRQTQRLQELGVPGLGGHGEEQVKRVKRLMDVIQAGMDA
jgi:hypothetical protein